MDIFFFHFEQIIMKICISIVVSIGKIVNYNYVVLQNYL